MLEKIKNLLNGNKEAKRLESVIESLKASEQKNRPVEFIRIGFEEWKV